MEGCAIPVEAKGRGAIAWWQAARRKVRSCLATRPPKRTRSSNGTGGRCDGTSDTRAGRSAAL